MADADEIQTSFDRYLAASKRANGFTKAAVFNVLADGGIERVATCRSCGCQRAYSKVSGAIFVLTAFATIVIVCDTAPAGSGLVVTGKVADS